MISWCTPVLPGARRGHVPARVGRAVRGVSARCAHAVRAARARGGVGAAARRAGRVAVREPQVLHALEPRPRAAAQGTYTVLVLRPL